MKSVFYISLCVTLVFSVAMIKMPQQKQLQFRAAGDELP